MSTGAIGVAAPDAVEATIVIGCRPESSPEPDHAHIDETADHDTDSTKPTGLHSPPDSNDAMKLDGSDSELSDLDDDIAEELKHEPIARDFPQEPAGQESVGNDPKDEPLPPKKDIGDIYPDHWSGTVPVFKPTMEQFDDFKLFVSRNEPSAPFACWRKA